MGNAAQIGSLNQSRIFLSARAAADNKRLFMLHEIRRHRRFDTDLVNGINNEVKRPSEKLVQIVFGNKIFDFRHFALRIDLGDAFAQSGNFCLTEIIGQSVQLAIDIGLGNVVQINQR